MMHQRIKNSLLFIIAIASLSSCVTIKRCNEKFPPQISVIVHDSVIVKDSIVIKHDTIVVPGEDVRIHDTIPCPELVYHRSITKNNLTATVNIDKGKIDFECHEDSLKKIIDVQSHLITTLHDHSKSEVKTVNDYKTHWYDIVCRWLSVIFLIVIAFFIGKKYFKPV